MTAGLVFAYSLVVLGPLTLLYIILLFFEYTNNNRFASDVRLYLDEKILFFVEITVQEFERLSRWYVVGNKAMKDEIIDPISEPFLTTKEHYTVLKTGRRNLAGRSTKGISANLKALSKE